MTRAKEILGWQQKISLEKGLGEALKYFKP